MDKLLDVSELSEILGVTKATIYSWTSQNKIPHIKLSKRLLKFRKDEITDWIAKRSVNADTIPLVRRKNPIASSPDSFIERIINKSKDDILG